MTKTLFNINGIFVWLICIWIGFFNCSNCCILSKCMPFTQRCFTNDIQDPCRANVGCYNACPDGSSNKGETLIPAYLDGVVVRGNSIFSSVPQINLLWHRELKNIKFMEKIVDEMDNPPQALKVYITSHYTHQLNQTPNYNFLGHPLNCYHLIRHIASGWDSINNNILKNEAKYGHATYFKTLTSYSSETLPDMDDVVGAAVSIVKLWIQYRIEMVELVRYGKIVTTMENGKEIESEPSVVKIDAFDLYTMTMGGLANRLYNAAAAFSQSLITQVKKEEKLNILNYEYLWKFNISSVEARAILSNIKQLHDSNLKNNGQASTNHECNETPFDKKLEVNKYVEDMPLIYNAIVTRKTLYNISENQPELFLARKKNSEKLCKGRQLLTAQQKAHLRCYHSSSKSDWLKIAPLKFQINSHDPFHVTIKQLLFDQECDAITSNNTHRTSPRPRIDKFYGNDKLSWNDVRLMQNVLVQEDTSNVYNKLNRRIEEFTSLNSNTTTGEAEAILLGSYGVGGSYWPHVDYKGAEATGNRVATIINVLEAPKIGGATIVPYAGITVFPEKGDGIFWHNLFKKGDIDYYTTHMGCPVLIGVKVIGNKWIGYNAQWNGTKCGLSMDAIFGSLDPTSTRKEKYPM